MSEKPLTGKIMAALLLSFCVLAMSNTPPIASKIRELGDRYQQKKAAGYDLSEVDKTIAQIQKARREGDRTRFAGLLKQAEAQLEQAPPPAPKAADEKTVPLPPLTPLSDKVVPADAPWPMYGHDPRHTCRSPYRGLTVPPDGPKWIFPSPGGPRGFTSSIAVGDDGLIYAGTAQNSDFMTDKARGHSGVLFALSPGGRKVWQYDSQSGSPLICMIESGPLLTADGRIIFGKDDGHVYALNKHGRVLWDLAADDAFTPGKYDDNEQFIPSPVLGPDNTLYAVSHFGNVYDSRTISALKKIPQLKAIIDRYGIKGVDRPVWGKVYALDARTGARKWVFDPSADRTVNKITFFGSPAVGRDGTLYATAYSNTREGYLYALNPDGTLKWRYPDETGTNKIQALCSPPAIGDGGTIYAGSYGDKENAGLYAFNPDGTLKWRFEIAENRITSGPGLGPDGTLYFGSHNHPAAVGSDRPPRGALYAIKDAGSGAELKWKFDVKYGITASPAIDKDGNVFFCLTAIQPLPYGSLGDYGLYALNSKGEKLWEYPLKGYAWGAPAIGKDGSVYVGIIRGEAGVVAFGP
jgi:outer membrane protein assembly factor BamB